MPTLSGQDEALDSLITGRQWKEAFKLCEKKLKKAKDSDYLQAKKISILISWPDRARKEQGLKELNALLQRTPPVTDIETLLFLENFENPHQLLGTPLGGEIGKNLTQIWSKAVASRPQDEKLLSQWYRTKFEMGDMEGARQVRTVIGEVLSLRANVYIHQASSMWQKNFPKDRRPFFLWILTAHLLSKSPDTSEMLRKIHGGVAYKNISKAMEYTNENKPDTETAKRNIRTLEDMLFLIRIYRAQGKDHEAIKIIRVPTFDKLVEGQKDSRPLCSELLELFEKLQEWEKLRDYCYEELRKFLRKEPLAAHLPQHGDSGDDWKIWQGFLRANEELANQPNASDTSVVSEILYSAKPKTRNGRLALLSYSATEASTGRQVPFDLKSALCGHFHDLSSKFICFEDLKRYLRFLDREQQVQLLMFASDHAQQSKPGLNGFDSERIQWITSEVNALKLDYNLVVSTNKDENRGQVLTAFITNCLRLYRVSVLFHLDLPKSDRRPGDDAAILAAMALVRLYKLKIPAYNNSLLRAILVLELLLQNSNHNYDALLILVRLYMYYGAGSLAMARYSALSIRNMQNASLSWILYTRISSIHPYASTLSTGDGKTSVTTDPLEEATRAHGWHGNGRDLSLRAISAMEDRGQWNMILDTLEMAKALESSFSRFLLVAEIKRMGRFRGTTHDASNFLGEDLIPKLTIHLLMATASVPSKTTDTRDRSPFPNFESGQRTFEANIPMVGTSVAVNDKWLWSEFVLTRLWDRLHNDGYSSIREEDLNRLRDHCEELPDSCTHEENTVTRLALLLTTVYEIYNPKRRTVPTPSSAGNFIKNLLEMLDTWLCLITKYLEAGIKTGQNASAALTVDLRIPHWHFYHARYTYFDLCKCITAVLNFALAENRKQAEDRKQGGKTVAPVHMMELKVTKVLNECKTLTAMIHRSADELRDRLRGPATFQEIYRAVVGHADASEDFIGQEFGKFDSNEAMTKICKDIQGSWIEGLDGVIGTTKGA